MAGHARGIRPLDDGLYALQTVGRARGLVEGADATTESRNTQSECDLYGQQRHPGSPPCCGCPKKRGCQALGRSRGGFGTKIHVLVDSFGRLLKLVLSPGQSSDHKYASELAGQAIAYRAQAVMGDRGYDSAALRRQIDEAGLESVIPFRKYRKVRPEIDRARYKERNVVERFIGRLKENRRVATRYDKKATHFAGFLILAAIKNWLKIIC